MSDITGTIHEVYDGKSYDLRLTMRGIATLQSEYGNNVTGLFDGSAGDSPDSPSLPDFNALLSLVSISLQKGNGMDAGAADELADDLLTKDPEIVSRIISAAFPDQKEQKSGNVKKPRKKAA